MHYIYLWGSRQVPDQGAVPIMELMETSLRQRSGSGIVVAVNPSCLDFGHF